MGENMNDKQICLNRSVLDFMDSKLHTFETVFEFGGGWSSRWFADRCQQLRIFETNKEWADKIVEDVHGANCVWVIHTLQPEQYLSQLIAVTKHAPMADLILIDCAEMFRNVTTHIAWTLLASGGWIIFDDAQRVRHLDAVQWLNRVAGDPILLEWETCDLPAAQERVALAWQKPE